MNTRSEKIAVLESYIPDIPDVSKPGIIFTDITPLLSSYSAFDGQVLLNHLAPIDAPPINLNCVANLEKS